MYLSQSGSLPIIAAAITGLTLMVCPRAIAAPDAERANAENFVKQEAKPNRIQFEYVPPKIQARECLYACQGGTSA